MQATVPEDRVVAVDLHRPLLGVALVMGCAVSDAEIVVATADTADTASVAWLEASQVTYVVRHDWSGTEIWGDTRVVSNDLGYRIGLTHAELATTNLEMVPCEDPSVYLRHANHEHDASQVVSDALVDLLGADTWFGPAESSNQPYCSVYEVMGPAGDAASVVRLSGWFESPDGERTALEVDSPVPVSGIHPLEPDSTPGAAHAPAVVVITRHVATAFEGIDLAARSDLDIAYDVAWNLAWTTTASAVAN